MTQESSSALRIVAMLTAGGRVGELSVLTHQRPKAALPFAGYYRIIDFPLSNLMRAGINNVGLLSQYRPASLIDHVGTGESWDFTGLDRGAKILPPFLGDDASDWYRGNADAVFQNLNYIRDTHADLVLILSGDHIYSMDYRDLIHTHLERGADLTIAFKPMSFEPRFGYGSLGEDGRVLEYEEKPSTPRAGLASLTIYLFNKDVLCQVLQDGQGGGDRILEFGRHAIPSMIDRYKVHGYVFGGYWAYARTIETYYLAHRDLFTGEVDMDAWGIRTNLHDTLVASQPPARFGPRARVESSFVSTGCEVNGTVVRSVLSPGVRIEEGAHVEDSILCHNTWVHAGSEVYRTISDKHIVIGVGSRVGESGPADGPASKIEGQITMIGKNCQIGDGAVLRPGAEILPETEVADGERVERSGGS